MADVETEIRRLQVANLPPADSGRGMARVPRKIMDELGLSDGDVIEIVGKRATPAPGDPALWRRRRARHHPPRRPSARQCRSRLG